MNLQSWYLLSRVDADEHSLRVRLRPDHFNAEHIDPIIEAEISSPQASSIALEQLARYESDFIVELQLLPTGLEIWGEFDEAPTVIAGASISVRQGPYSTDDLLQIVHCQKATIARLHRQEAELRRTAHEVDAFVQQLMRRAEIRKARSGQCTEREDAQLDVLQRVANKLLEGRAASS